MANEEQVALLKAGVEEWNRWQDIHNRWQPKIDLREADLNEANLRAAKLSKAKLNGARLFRADLSGAMLFGANLSEANLSHANLSGANLGLSNLRGTNLRGADLGGADLRGAKLHEADLGEANLRNANLFRAILRGANLNGANLGGADLGGANLRAANLRAAQLQEAKLSRADLRGANISRADLRKADLNGARLREADLGEANLHAAKLTLADLSGANLSLTNLFRADLSESNLSEANFRGANLSEADLRAANLRFSNLVRANTRGAKLSKCKVYGINVWDLKGEFEEQMDLIITPLGQPSITVDDIKVAQLIYLTLETEDSRREIDTLTSKTVLILGRFTPQRTTILDAIRERLRAHELAPIVVDFGRPTDKDFTETVKTLIGMSYFVIVDLSGSKSVPLELQVIVPNYGIPFVPILQKKQKPFAVLADLQKQYDWVLDTVAYDSVDTLIAILAPHVIEPAMKKREELRLNKAKRPKKNSG